MTVLIIGVFLSRFRLAVKKQGHSFRRCAKVCSSSSQNLKKYPQPAGFSIFLLGGTASNLGRGRKGGTPALWLAWHCPRHRARPFQALLFPKLTCITCPSGRSLLQASLTARSKGYVCIPGFLYVRAIK